MVKGAELAVRVQVKMVQKADMIRTDRKKRWPKYHRCVNTLVGSEPGSIQRLAYNVALNILEQHYHRLNQAGHSKVTASRPEMPSSTHELLI